MSTAPGVIIAAPSSGSGKTTVTLGLLRHLRDEGLNVRSYKVGPDYIDPAFHGAASGVPCLNADGWAMRPATLEAVMRDADEADLVICEGAMGLFDAREGSPAALSRITGWPIVLVVDVQGMGASIAALLEGFCNHDPDVTVA
ncbi:MAG: cobyrinic acid a,c-diamide synthase, partial [Kiloniellales bacterium]|nr:cobyrinic acid a,c-diamide synthase [Kiloniellales bacterium]